MIRKNQQEERYLSFGQLNLITSSRFNWALLAAWTREYIHSVTHELRNIKEIGDRLYRVPVDFYNLVIPFVGKANADRVLNLTSLRMIVLMTIINAMKNCIKALPKIPSILPNEAFRDWVKFLPARSSPMMTPKTEPIINPKGPREKIPKIPPIIPTHIPYLLAPNFLTPQ